MEWATCGPDRFLAPPVPRVAEAQAVRQVPGVPPHSLSALPAWHSFSLILKTRCPVKQGGSCDPRKSPQMSYALSLSVSVLTSGMDLVAFTRAFLANVNAFPLAA